MNYVIQIQDQENGMKYVTKGDYARYELTSSLQAAIWFNTMEQVEEVLTHPEMVKRVGPYSDGSTMPPSLIWSGLGINNARPIADGFINILEIRINGVKSTYVKDQLYSPLES